MKSSNNNETMLAIRTIHQLKDMFNQTCKNMDTTAAQEIRKFMRDFIKKNGQKELPL